MKIVVDTNVFLDVFLVREPLIFPSAEVLALGKTDDFDLIIPAHAIPTIIHITTKNADRQKAHTAVENCLSLARVGTLDESAIRLGLTYEFRDLEDAFVAAIAEQESASCIVTNNVRDFKASPVSVFTPKDFLTWHKN